MQIQKIDGVAYGEMVKVGASRLNSNRKVINDLNVFPIPDGDTGDNMYMTIESGSAADIEESLSNTAKKVSAGMLLGARGNSGVILSRIFAGIAKGLEGVEQADIDTWRKAMNAGVEESYKAVSEPVEGTILTVFKDGVNVANASGAEDFGSYFATMITEMEASLDRTPELLPCLKEAGVVDSGGAGILCVVRGMAASLDGEKALGPVGPEPTKHKVNLDKFDENSTLEFGYCTEFLLRLQTSKIADLASFDESVIKDYLNSVGESVVCFREGTIVKVHVHTFRPGDILSHVQQWGEFLTLKIENMTLQHSEVEIKDEFSSSKPRKRYGIVTVASGKGLVQTFKDAGADEVIEGGQTMNPSAQDFLNAFDKVNAETVFVFPNNSNIILTAEQAARMYPESKVLVIPAKTIGAGYVGIASMDLSEKDHNVIARNAVATIDSVCTGMVSRAVRDSVQDNLEIKEGDYIGFERSRILVCKHTAREAAFKLARKINVGNHDVAVIFYGADSGEQEAKELARDIQALYPRTEIMLTDGGQPVYNYIIVLC